MRLTMPEPKIELYKDGFAKHDKLDRKATGDRLSELVERLDDPLVIALDGAWGSGKSLFLKCWVGEHLKRDGNTTQTVYFDAFKHDFLDDPLIALTGAIAERFHDAEAEAQEQDAAKNAKRRKKFKKTAWAVSKAAGRIGLSAVTFGATEILSDMGDELAKATSDEIKTFLSSDEGDKESEKFWNAHTARMTAMDAFRAALTELTEPFSAEDEEQNSEHREDTPSRKLVIVIDELDRCRPDYALSLLEVIKHFFNVDGVHFVLGVNLLAMQNSVRMRYGSGIDAMTYLQKFQSLILRLPEMTGYRQPDLIAYFDLASGKMQLDTDLHDAARSLLQRYRGTPKLSLRSVERFLTILALLPSQRMRGENVEYIVHGALMKTCLPEMYEDMKNNRLTLEQLQQSFNLEEFEIPVWQTIFSAARGEQSEFAGSTRVIPTDFLPNICNRYLEVFDASDLSR